MITSKQRAYLRSLTNKIEPIVYIGKAGITENLVEHFRKRTLSRLTPDMIRENVSQDNS